MFQSNHNGPMPYPIPSAELDAMLANISNQMAHAQILRRLSGNSNGTSTSSRRTSKVLKSNSVGNSPHNCNIQRRKTTTSQPTRQSHSAAQDRYQARGLRLGNNHTPWRQVVHSRPVSWHPSSRNVEVAARNAPTCEPTMRNTIAGLETLAVAEVQVSSSQPFMENNTTVPTSQPYQDSDTTFQPRYCGNRSPAMFEQPLANLTGYQPTTTSDGTIFSSYPYNTPNPYQAQNPPRSYGYGYDQYGLGELQASDWAHLSSSLDDYPVPQTPDFLPIQNPADIADTSDFPQITKRKSKELVGMGLYDNTERDLISPLDLTQGHCHNHLGGQQRESMGKGLKLEETWQPPKDDDADEDDDEEASSADEGEEDVPVSFAQDETQPAFYPTHGDLSNQTFFFDNDDQYTSCMAFDPAMQVCQPKAPDPAMETSLWF